MRYWTRRLAAAAAVSVAIAAAGVAGQDAAAACRDARFAPAMEAVRTALADDRLPSVSIAVAVRGRVACEAAFGFADIQRRIPAAPSTMYSLASISKPFTATAAMALVERGVLKLERAANEYLGPARLRAFEGYAEDATLLRLLTHTAGLPLHYQFFYAGGPAVPAMDAAIAQYGIIVYPPGERYFYSNFGYGVVERMIERAGGKPYAGVLHETVLDPLGLAETMVSDGAGLEGGTAARRYGAGGVALPSYTFDHVAASGVWSSARDLVRFGTFHLGHDAGGTTPALSRETRRVMQRDHARADSPGRTRGLGWGIAESASGWRQVAHTGLMPGVSTMLSLYPEADVAIVVLTNTSNPRAVARIERALASAALPKPPGAIAAPAAQAGGAAGPDDGSRRAGAGVAALVGGRWSGRAVVHGETVPVVLDVRGDEDVRIRIGGMDEAVEGARVSDRWFSGRTAARLAPPDAAPASSRDEHRTLLTLARRGDRLTGWAAALSTADPTYGAVSFAIQLTRAETPK